MAKVVSVISGKGGCGKTAVAVNIAAGFKQLKKNTLIIDCSFGVRNDDIPLARSSLLLYNIGDVVQGEVNVDEAIIAGEEAYMPDFLASSPFACPPDLNKLLSRLISCVSKKYDFIIIDTPASSGIEFDACTSLSDIILAVTTEDILSASNTELCLGRISDTQSKETYLIINRAGIYGDECTLCAEELADEIGAGIIGIIREDVHMSKCLLSGDPIIRYDTFAGRELENVCRRLCREYISPTKHTSTGRFFEKNRLILKI